MLSTPFSAVSVRPRNVENQAPLTFPPPFHREIREKPAPSEVEERFEIRHFPLALPPSFTDNTPNEPGPQKRPGVQRGPRDVRNQETATTRREMNKTGDCPSRSLHEPRTYPLDRRLRHRSAERQIRNRGASLIAPQFLERLGARRFGSMRSVRGNTVASRLL